MSKERSNQKESRSKSKSRSPHKRSRSRSRNKQQYYGDLKDFNTLSQERKRVREQILRQFKRQSSQSKSGSDSDSSQPKQKQIIKPSIERPMFPSIQKQKQKVVSSVRSESDMDMFDIEPDHQAHNNPTDPQGYYRVIKGQILNKTYKIQQTLGKGVFGNVIKVTNTQNNTQYAIKILRFNEMISQSGQKEANILKKINNPHIIKCYETFNHRSHLCLVFQLLGLDARARMKQKLFTLDEIKAFSIQLFIGIHAMRKNKLIHADIKPDNLLFTLNKENIKICDFGTAFNESQASIIEYLVARYYRAPEIMLGCSVDYSVDVWSIGCTLYEMVTGQFLFPGKDNNEVLKYIMRTRGKFSLKMLRKGAFTEKHFDKNYNFIDRQVDPVSLQIVHRPVTVSQDRELLKLLKEKNHEETKKQVMFKDFIERCLALNPKNRLTPAEALQHPFLNHQLILK